MNIPTAQKENIFQFIRLAILGSQQIDILLPSMIQPLAKPDTDLSKVQNLVREIILSDQHLGQFVPMIESVFSPEEIKRLIEFYKDPVIVKYLQNGGVIGTPIYSSIAKVIKEILSV